jgi:lysyl endopeptidase
MKKTMILLSQGLGRRQLAKCRSLLVGLLCLILPTLGFAKMYEEPRSFALKDASQEKVQVKVLAKIDPEQLLAEDKTGGKDVERPTPLRFAVVADVDFSIENSGTWTDLPDGRLWRLRIQSPGAINLNFGITRFEMPEGAKLWIYDLKHTNVEGPYTSKNRSHLGSLWTPMIAGEEVVIEVFVPSGVSKPVVEIRKANQGYRDFTKAGIFGGSSGACMTDVICPQGDNWRPQIRAINLFTIRGFEVCTGNLLNNTALDFKPYVLSARHCRVTGGDDGSDATIVVYWNFQSPTCGTHAAGPLTDNQTGAFFRAASPTSDFVLFELEAVPDSGFNVFYAGWDASGTPPPGVVGIHHPSGDVKAISLSKTAPTKTANNSDTPNPNGTHWRVVWDGPSVTEGGSSGSCIFRTDNGRCIGQLSGGPADCGVAHASMHDFFGRLDLSWTGGGTPATRLRDWLDPGNTGAVGLEGRPAPQGQESGPVIVTPVPSTGSTASRWLLWLGLGIVVVAVAWLLMRNRTKS